jgi:hypothetical protein
LRAFYPAIIIDRTRLKQYSFVYGQNYHYKILDEREYNMIRESGIYA